MVQTGPEVMDSNDLWQPLSPQGLRPIVVHWARGHVLLSILLVPQPQPLLQLRYELGLPDGEVVVNAASRPGVGKGSWEAPGGGGDGANFAVKLYLEARN